MSGMDYRLWAAALLRDNTDLAYEVNVFLEKRWRDGRHPQPRDRHGRWVKHAPNLHVGVGQAGGSGHGAGFLGGGDGDHLHSGGKLRVGDHENVGPKRLNW